MRILNFLMVSMIIMGTSCTNKCGISDQDKKMVETEIQSFIKSMETYAATPDPEKYFDCFLHTNELTAASQGVLMTDPAALYDTIKAHLSVVKNQSIKTVDERIIVINKEAAVLSTSKVTTITFLNDSQITMPYAWTMLLLKRDGAWKVAHIHN
jgi:hypothetical protein